MRRYRLKNAMLLESKRRFLKCGKQLPSEVGEGWLIEASAVFNEAHVCIFFGILLCQSILGPRPLETRCLSGAKNKNATTAGAAFLKFCGIGFNGGSTYYVAVGLALAKQRTMGV